MRDRSILFFPRAAKTRASVNRDEALVIDPRGSLTPAQCVENKLLSLLGKKAIPVSYRLFGARLVADRGRQASP